MKQIIIGLVGPLASGKGFLASQLERRGFICKSLSDTVREEARKRGIALTRENLQDIGNELRDRLGGHILAQRTLEQIESDQRNWVIESIRNPEEIKFLRENYDVFIIGVDAPVDLRLSWYLDRAKERKEDSSTVIDFYKADGRDSGVNEGDTGQQVRKCLLLSDVIIENRGSKTELVDLLNKVLLEEYGTTLEGQFRPIENK